MDQESNTLIQRSLAAIMEAELLLSERRRSLDDMTAIYQRRLQIAQKAVRGLASTEAALNSSKQ
jgi:hypothetical protein